MANTFLIKRSSTSGKSPASADIQVGELAVNTAGAKLYTKKSDGSIVLLNVVSGVDDVYVNTTRYESEKIRRYYTTATTDSNGRLTVYPTTTGTTAGNALFSTIVSIQSNPSVSSTDPNQYSYFNRETISADFKTVTLRGVRGTAILLLNSATAQFVGAGIQVYVEIVGLP